QIDYAKRQEKSPQMVSFSLIATFNRAKSGQRNQVTQPITMVRPPEKTASVYTPPPFSTDGAL
ncbi:MAG: hypothetical protein K2Z81_22540, partial [Cyanobacteria bacterium]|nr:hypothetical protein [Cyanobacteriota bacterium]